MKNHLFLAFTNLKRRKLRSWLTILGIFIGIAAVVSLISLGQGLQNFIDTQFEQLGADKIIIEPESFGPPGSVSDEQLILDDGDLKTIQNFRGVESAESILTRTGVIENKKEQEVVFINGVSEEYINLFDGSDFVEVIEGRQIKNSDNSKTVVGYNHVYGNIWENELRVGSSIEIKGKKFDIVGVLRKQGNPFDDNSIWIEKETLRNIFEIGNEEGIIVAKADSGFDVEVIAEGIRNELRNEKDQEEGEETFSVQTSAQLLETFSTIFTVIQAVFVGIAAISLVVGGIGIRTSGFSWRNYWNFTWCRNRKICRICRDSTTWYKLSTSYFWLAAYNRSDDFFIYYRSTFRSIACNASSKPKTSRSPKTCLIKILF